MNNPLIYSSACSSSSALQGCLSLSMVSKRRGQREEDKHPLIYLLKSRQWLSHWL